MSGENSSTNVEIASVRPAAAVAVHEDIEIFREYLRIPSVHPDIDYEPCVQFLRRQADRLQLACQVHHSADAAAAADGEPPKPVVVITWPGAEPALPSIVLNSHMDVVPVYRDAWTHDPFAGDLDAVTGRIYGRGAQDMKCIGVQYLAAIRALRAQQFVPRRTVHVVFVPDEEIGGVHGMLAFTQTDAFRALNVGFALDEGIASASDVYPVFYAERCAWFVHIHCPGTTGHGSLLHADTAGEKVASILANFAQFRRTEVAKLAAAATQLTVGDVTTINLTMLRGGVQVNVVPPAMRISFDIRLAVTVDADEFERMLRQWCSEAGDDVTIEFGYKTPLVEPTRLDETNAFWVAFKKATDELHLQTRTHVYWGATDSRHLRQLGIPAIGFSPIINTPVLLHGNDEFLSADTFVRGIEIYTQILKEVTHA